MAPHHLAPRAELTVAQYTLIAVLVSLLICGLFCVGVLFCMFKRKRTLAARQRDLASEQQRVPLQQGAAHEYRVLEDNRGDMGMGYNGPIELQGNVGAAGTESKPQQLAGYAVPASAQYDGRPVELGANR